MFASSKTIKGALPPASKDTLRKSHQKKRENRIKATNFFKVPAAILYNSFATGVDPVKLTFLIILFSHISLPTSRTFFWVVTILITPSGIPARRPSYPHIKHYLSERDKKANHTSARARQENGVSGGGLTTAVHPAARAAPSFRVIIADGKFHGVRMEL